MSWARILGFVALPFFATFLSSATAGAVAGPSECDGLRHDVDPNLDASEFTNVAFRGEVVIQNPRGFVCTNCCFEGLRFRGTIEGPIRLRDVRNTASTLIEPYTKLGSDFEISSSYLENVFRGESFELSGALRIEGTAFSGGGGIEIRDTSIGTLAFNDVRHKDWIRGRAEGRVVDAMSYMGVQLSNIRVRGRAEFQNIGMSSLLADGQFQVGDTLTWRRGGVGRIEIRNATVGNGTFLDFEEQDARDVAVSVSKSLLGPNSVLRLPPSDGSRPSSRLIMSDVAGAFRELPPLSVLGAALGQGRNPDDLRMTLMRLARSYESLGMTKDSQAAKHWVASLDLDSHSWLLEKCAAFLRWLGSGAGAYERLLFGWLLLWALVGVPLFLMSLLSVPYRFLRPKKDSGAQAEQVSTRERVRLASLGTLSTVFPGTLDVDIAFASWAFCAHVVGRLYMWVLLWLTAGALVGYI